MILTASILLIFGVLMIVLYLRDADSHFYDPIPVSWFGFIVFFPVMLFGISGTDYGTDNSYYVFLYVLFTLAYTAGVYLFRANTIAATIPTPVTYLDVGPSWVALLVLLAILGLLFVIPDSVPLIYVYRNAVVRALLLFAVYMLVFLRRRYITRFVVAAGFLTAIPVTVALAYSRRSFLAIFVMLAGAVYYQYLDRKPLLLRLAVMAAVAFLLVVAMTYHTQTRGARVLGYRQTQEVSISDINAYRRLFGGIDIGFNVCKTTIQHMEFTSEYRYGGTYINGLLFFIPRFIWHNKPESGGGIATQIFVGKDDSSYSVSPTPVGEAYINGGMLAVALVGFVWGCIVRIVNTYFVRNRGNIFLLLMWLAISLDVVGQWRGDFTSMYVSSAMRVCVIFAMLYLAKWCSPYFHATPSVPAHQQLTDIQS